MNIKAVIKVKADNSVVVQGLGYTRDAFKFPIQISPISVGYLKTYVVWHCRDGRRLFRSLVLDNFLNNSLFC